jgi:exocyst complex component 5
VPQRDLIRATAFDPQPFIRTFESAVDSLIEIRKDLQKRTEQNEQAVKAAEKDYTKRLAELNTGFEVTTLAATHSL